MHVTNSVPSGPREHSTSLLTPWQIHVPCQSERVGVGILKSLWTGQFYGDLWLGLALYPIDRFPGKEREVR